MTVYLTYQQLLNAVYLGTGATSGSVYPNDYKYIAVPISVIGTVLGRYNAGPYIAESDDCDDKARRLWYAFKETNPLYACGIVRLSQPVAHDLLGVVTEEDMHAGVYARSIVEVPDLTKESLLSDDLAEYLDDRIPESFGPSGGPVFEERPISAIPVNRALGGPVSRPAGRPVSRPVSGNSGFGRVLRDEPKRTGVSGPLKVEMSLVDPLTELLFKRSQGGRFGNGWAVSQIRAMAVWF